MVHQRAVAVLEHVQGQRDAREHHSVQGEDGQLLAHALTLDLPT